MNALDFALALGFCNPRHVETGERDTAAFEVSVGNALSLIKQWGDNAEVAGYDLEYMGHQPATQYHHAYLAVYCVKQGDVVLGYMELHRAAHGPTRNEVEVLLLTADRVEAQRKRLIADYKREAREAKRMLKKDRLLPQTTYVLAGKAVDPQTYHDQWNAGLVALQSHAYPEFFNY